nr:FaeA/PapI family transcriptional regulator [Pantoea sp. 201603H]
MHKANKMLTLSQKEQTLSSAIIRIVNKRKPKNQKETGLSFPELIWLSTREIAEECDMDIYKTRYYLLKLESKGIVIRRHEYKKTASHWYLNQRIASFSSGENTQKGV